VTYLGRKAPSVEVLKGYSLLQSGGFDGLLLLPAVSVYPSLNMAFANFSVIGPLLITISINVHNLSLLLTFASLMTLRGKELLS